MNLTSMNRIPEAFYENQCRIIPEKIEALFGEEDVIRQMEAPDNGTPVHVFFYYDLPEKGMLTSVTYGLSEGDHPNWKFGRPELILTLQTQNEDWGLAAAYFAAQFRGKKKFSYQSIFTLDEPISDESLMTGFFLFAPAILTPESSKIELIDRTIILTGMYPIYKEETELLQKIGLDAFWHLDGFDLYDVKRKNLGL